MQAPCRRVPSYAIPRLSAHFRLRTSCSSIVASTRCRPMSLQQCRSMSLAASVASPRRQCRLRRRRDLAPPFCQRQCGTRDLAHERLGLQGGMRGDLAFARARRSAANHVEEGPIRRCPRVFHGRRFLAPSPPSACGTGPRSPSRSAASLSRPGTRRGRSWAVAAAQRLHQADDLSSLLEPALLQRRVDPARKQRIGGREDVSARHEHSQGTPSPAAERTRQAAASPRRSAW